MTSPSIGNTAASTGVDGQRSQLETAAHLARMARTYRLYARMFRNGTTVAGHTQFGCERGARRMEQIIRHMADANIACAAAEIAESESA